jgi:hypothetical protein
MDANKFIILEQRFEGQDLQRFMKGTSDAKEYAVSFYVKGNASATYVVELFDVDNTRRVSKTFSVTTSWTRVELTFPADTTGAFDDDTAQSLNLHLWMVAGTTYTGGTLSQTWIAHSDNDGRATGGNNFFSSTDNTFFITGVQLEVGSVATEFEHRSFGEELALCQRYFQDVTLGNRAAYRMISTGQYTTSTNYRTVLNFTQTMRATPSVTTSGNFEVSPPGGNLSSIAISRGSSVRADITATSDSSQSAGYAGSIRTDNDTSATFFLDAEL